VGSLKVIALEPGLEGPRALCVVKKDLAVGPLNLQRSVESFDFSVLPGTVGLDENVASVKLAEDSSKVVAQAVAVGIVGHDLLDADNAALEEESSGPSEKACAGGTGLVGEDLGVGEATVVVHH